jgi:hypothetical protein
VRFVLELTPTEDGRVEGVLVREGSDEPQRFSGWLDLLRLLERSAGHRNVAADPRPGPHGGNDVDAAGGQGHGFPFGPLNRPEIAHPFRTNHMGEDRLP